jgi:hypothetical protein
MPARLALARLLAVALAAAALLAAAAPAAFASSRQISIFEDEGQLIESSDAVRQDALNQLQALGVDEIRAVVIWNRVAPSPFGLRRPAVDLGDPRFYPGWGPYDALVREAQARGMRVLLTPSGFAPAWASECRGSVKLRETCRPRASDYGSFVGALGRRYPTVRNWSIWNEPNLSAWLAPQRVRSHGRTYNFAARRYRDLFRAATRALAATGHGRDQILLGEAAPVGNRRTTPPATFLREVLCIDGRGRALRGTAARIRGCTRFPRLAATGIAHHPYTATAALRPTWKGGPNDIPIASLSRLTTIASQAARRGRLRRGLGIYITEMGFQTIPGVISPANQAQYINWADWIAYRNPRVRSVGQYILRDGGARFHTGLRYTTGAPKPSYGAYRLPLFVVRSGSAHVRVFGQVRPLRAGGTQVTLEHKRSAGAAWRRLATITVRGQGYLYRRVSGRSGFWRLVWGPYVSRTASARRA